MTSRRVFPYLRLRVHGAGVIDAACRERVRCRDRVACFDGTIASYAWNFGDGGLGSGQAPSHTYSAGVMYLVTLTVTDDDNATGSTSRSITVTAPSTGIMLSAVGYKVKGVRNVDLSWSGASGFVNIYRDNGIIGSVLADGLYTDTISRRAT